MTRIEAVAVLGLVGAVCGSFVSTAALRTAAGDQVLHGRSRCDGCGRPLSWLETLPIVSYVGRRGRCADCGSRISAAHLCGELAGAGAALLLGLRAPLPAALATMLMGAALLAASIIDARTQRLPDPLTLVVAVCAAYLASRSGVLQVGIGTIAAIVSATLLLALRRAFLRSRGDPSLGLGDVKLVAALAIWLGPNTSAMVAAAAALALVVVALKRPKAERVAFGPMIAAAGWSIGVAGELRLWPS